MLYTITVDTEEEWDWNSGYPTESNSVKNIAALPRFQEVCDRFNARVTYFVDYAVLANQRSAAIVTDLAAHPHVEIGFHIHPWNTPPLSNLKKVPVQDSFLHNLPSDLAIAKLDAVMGKFREHGLIPTSFRGGRYSTSELIQNHLYEQGCIADASILPHTTWPDQGAPDYRRYGLLPFRRQIKESGPGFWHLPLTLGFTRSFWAFWRSVYAGCGRSPWNKLRLVGIMERVWVQRVWLNFEHPLGQYMDRLLPLLRTANLPVINFTMHSSSLLPGLNPYVRNEEGLRKLYERLENALSIVGRWPDLSPATVTDAARHLERENDASSRN